MAIVSAQLLEALAKRFERAGELDPVAEKVAAVVDRVLSRPWVVNLVSGSLAGHSIHPLFVALPIGAWSTSLALDLYGMEQGARIAVGVGLVTAVPTVVTGLSDWRYTTGGERRVGLVHSTANALAIAAYAGSWLARRADRHRLGVVLSMAGMGAVSFGGWLGGHLSYALGVGVDTTAFQHSEGTWTAVADADDVRVGELSAAEVGGVPLVLTRSRTGAVVALAGRCTHRGGPLAEGTVRDVGSDQECIVCPWHGSAFALDGSVAQGPATRPEQAYEVEIRDGQVHVRVADEPRALRTRPIGV